MDLEYVILYNPIEDQLLRVLADEWHNANETFTRLVQDVATHNGTVRTWNRLCFKTDYILLEGTSLELATLLYSK